MESAQRCKDQAAECICLMNSAPTKDQARSLRNISFSWSRLAGQIDRYNQLAREQSRIDRAPPQSAIQNYSEAKWQAGARS
jgi:hypothetical protein